MRSRDGLCAVLGLLVGGFVLSACGRAGPPPEVEIGSAALGPDRTMSVCPGESAALLTRASGTDLEYTWSLDGAGQLQREGAASGDLGNSNRYSAPATLISEEGIEEVVKVTVTDQNDLSSTDQIIIKVVGCETQASPKPPEDGTPPPAPTATPEPTTAPTPSSQPADEPDEPTSDDVPPPNPESTPSGVAITITDPISGTQAVCEAAGACIFTVRGTAEGISGGLEIRLFVQPIDPGVPGRWYVQGGAPDIDRPKGSWKFPVQIGGPLRQAQTGDTLKVVAAVFTLADSDKYLATTDNHPIRINDKAEPVALSNEVFLTVQR